MRSLWTNLRETDQKAFTERTILDSILILALEDGLIDDLPPEDIRKSPARVIKFLSQNSYTLSRLLDHLKALGRDVIASELQKVLYPQ